MNQKKQNLVLVLAAMFSAVAMLVSLWMFFTFDSKVTEALAEKYAPTEEEEESLRELYREMGLQYPDQNEPDKVQPLMNELSRVLQHDQSQKPQDEEGEGGQP